MRAVRAIVIAATAAALVACGGGGGGGSPPPDLAIVSQPADAHVLDGDAVTLNVGVRGSATFGWERLGPGGWAAVAGGTSATLQVGAVHAADSGAQFRAVLTSTANSANRLTSSVATITVDARVEAPALLAGPVAQSVYDGQDASLNATATGTSLVYQWQRSADGGASWADIAGATATTYVFAATRDGDDGSQYRVIVRNSAGEVTSMPAALTVLAPPALPLFTRYPVFVTTTPGQPAVFDAQAVGTPAPTIAWQSSYGGDGAWSDIPGANGGSYTIAATSTADDGRRIRAVATNVNGVAFSSVAQLAVSGAPAAAAISEQPGDLVSSVGGVVAFEAYGFGSPAVSYQWQVSADGGATYTSVNGATSHRLSVGPNALADDGKRYRVVVANNLGSATSRAALLSVMEAPQVWSIGFGELRHPGLTDVTYSAQVGAGTQLHFQWRLGSYADAQSLADVAGATAREFTLPAATSADRDEVCVVVTNPAGSATSCARVSVLQWRMVSPQPTANHLLAASRVDGATAVASDINGAVLRSTDSGATWTLASDGFSIGDGGAHAMAFDGLSGLAVGSAWGSTVSDDGGLHWYPAPSSPTARNAVAFSSLGLAVAVGDQGIVQVSDDHGRTWALASTDANTNNLVDVAVRGGVGVAVGAGGTIRRSPDGGHAWTTVHVGGYPMTSVAFATNRVVVATDAQGVFWRSTDAGLTWTAGAPTNTWLRKLRFAPTGTGFVATSGGVLRSADAGVTWTLAPGSTGVQSSSGQGVVADFAFLDGGVAIGVGDAGTMLRSVDDGITFAPVSGDRMLPLLAVAAADPSTGVAVGWNGLLRRTTDAGATWTTVPAPTSSWLAGVAFSGPAEGIAVGTGGTILRTRDAGSTWTPVLNAAPYGDLQGVAYADASTVVVTGAFGIWRSTDGGATWGGAAGLGSTLYFGAVAFGDARNGVAVSLDGKVWHSGDAGAGWTVVATAAAPVATVAFATPTTVVALGSGGSALRSTDAGATWQTLLVQTDWRGITGVAFRDASVGYAVGGYIYKTTDGGVTWAMDASAQLTAAGAVAVFGSNAVVAVGQSGLVYRTDTD